MRNRRAPYYPPQHGGNFGQMPQFPYQQFNPMMPGNQPNSTMPIPPNQPSSTSSMFGSQAPQIPPYDYFAKPMQPSPWGNQPTQGAMGNQQPKNMLAYFQDKNGQLDIDKMLTTVGQAANTFQQVSPLMKQLGTIVKGFKV